jgi:hypothetical protein
LSIHQRTARSVGPDQDALRCFDTTTTGLVLRAAELGEKHAPLPTSEMKPLKHACAGVLAPGNALCNLTAQRVGWRPD